MSLKENYSTENYLFDPVGNPDRPNPRPMDTACELHRKRK